MIALVAFGVALVLGWLLHDALLGMAAVVEDAVGDAAQEYGG